ncbi:sensor histidine kinase [Aeromonas diversa CDC 2478-85]|uniref:histidine kinase n=1 Tax=Aeromonas diversa CDC 2478-85 TaxID=1268237 RepID=N9V5H2_9GAMM|nr:GAF domain-containing sensor histidine kinase [Aeromonas diversa]ENY70572.1 sensor histidine kinase [Aeromonas diversa CDC 2478-85]
MSASSPKYPIHADIEIPLNLKASWQQTLDLIARLFQVPASLIMRVHAREIEVFVSGHHPDNCYGEGAREHLDSGLYCEHVMDTRRPLIVPNALKDPLWDHNPDIKLQMISYCGLPILWPDGHIFGTICVLSREENPYPSPYPELLEQFRDSVQASLHILQDNLQLEATQEALVERGEQLSLALHSLKVQQEELLNHEKLAALGAMVAGVSHEFNTPLGNLVTLLSTLGERFTTMEKQLESKALARSLLEEFVAGGREICAVADKELHRLSRLIADFKRVSIEQVSEQRHRFDLRERVAQQIRLDAQEGGEVRIENRVPEGIECDSFPEPLGLLLHHLLQNAVRHGLVGVLDPAIVIDAEVREGRVALTVEDNGCGMPSQVQAHAFDPFFTTRLGHGSGMGLAISRRIASAILGGSLDVTPAPRSGCRFILCFPLCAPGRL